MDNDDPLMQICSRLAAARRTARLTVREAAARAGIHHTSIVRYEQGQLPKLEHLAALANAYRLSLPGLLTTDADLIRILDRLQDASPEQRARCLDVLTKSQH